METLNSLYSTSTTILIPADKADMRLRLETAEAAARLAHLAADSPAACVHQSDRPKIEGGAVRVTVRCHVMRKGDDE